MAAAGVGIGALWPDRAIRSGVAVGVAAAWAASAASVTWMTWALRKSVKAFWWSFGGGMALRASVLGVLTAWGASRAGVKIEAVLLSYVFALLAMMLILDFRYFKAQ